MVAAAGCASAPDATGDGAAAVSTSAIVSTTYGSISGVTASGVTAFKGIPFAGTTGGDARWRAPQPATPWPGVRRAASFGPKCLQPGDDNGPVGDEDCLSVNVWTPVSAGAKVPVIVFFYGGFNVTGSTSDNVLGTQLYDGANLALGGKVVVVTANYRVGAMGFLSHASFATAEAGGGNYGLMDQIEALRWVQKNVGAFGGDPANVMVMGQSAGAFDTCELVASPAAKGLFARAGMNSGGCRALSRATGEHAAEKVATNLGCSGDDAATCLRSKSPAELMNALPLAEAYAGTTYWPVVDGVILPKSPLDIINAGEHNKVPVLIGSNRDEATLIIRKFAPKVVDSQDALSANIGASYGPLADQVIAAYPAASYSTPDLALQQLLADAAFTCPTRRAARALATHGSSVYKFEFTHAIDDLLLHQYGASHGFELFYLFKNFVHWFPTSREKALADDLAGYWSRFAATGDPNGAGAVPWPTYDSAADSNLALDVQIQPEAGRETTQCDFWDSITPPSAE
jgi:para-nitrobenzyl esterase